MSAISNQSTHGQPAVEPERVGNQLQRYLRPVVDISETPEAFLVRADLPGVSKEGLDISVERNSLTIIGRRSQAEVTGEPLYRESVAADYRRVFELDPSIEAARIGAKIEQGVLTITLPKTERVKFRKVPVGE